jgi:uncharacterized membrane protein
MRVTPRMSRKRTFYFPHTLFAFIILALILALALFLVFIDVVGIAFREIGFAPTTVALILVTSLAGSYVNIPLLKLKATMPIVKEEYASFFGMVYRIPQVEYGETLTLVAINLGGAIIPASVSFYLLWKMPSAAAYALIGVAFVAVITHAVARPVKGVGIVTPSFVPPLVAGLIAYFLPFKTPQIIAYVAGVLGTLLGADLLNLRFIPKLGAPVVSIGGAGTFDGVFLSGIMAVLLEAII